MPAAEEPVLIAVVRRAAAEAAALEADRRGFLAFGKICPPA
jgi:hypothetical protein